MTELSFAKSFLTTLDAKPSKISAEHVEDPKTYPARGAYILPKASFPLSKKIRLAPGAEPSLSVTLKSLRNPPLDITFPSLPSSTSILSLKESISEQSAIPVSKLRLLWNKKPVGDSKTLKDVVGDDGAKGGRVELGVMVIGGAGAVKRDGEEVEPVVVGHGTETLRSEEFWTDLRGFLVARLKDEKEGERIWGVFRKAVEAEK